MSGGSVKPEKKRFQTIQERWSAKQYIYVGDNPEKDFLAPNSMGWMTIGLADDGRNMHPQNCVKQHQDSSRYFPRYWINSLPQMDDILCKHVLDSSLI